LPLAIFPKECAIVTSTPRWESNVSRQHYTNLAFADQTTRAQNAKSVRKVILRRPSVLHAGATNMDQLTLHVIKKQEIVNASGDFEEENATLVLSENLISQLVRRAIVTLRVHTGRSVILITDNVPVDGVFWEDGATSALLVITIFLIVDGVVVTP